MTDDKLSESELTLTEARDVLSACYVSAATPDGPHPFLFDTMTLVEAKQVLGAICEAVQEISALRASLTALSAPTGRVSRQE